MTMMSASYYNPSPRRDLQALVVETVPLLRDVLGGEDPTDPHRVMSALFDHATQSIQDCDIPEVIRCFRLAKQLVELEREWDLVTTSSIWTSYLGRFQHHDPQALKVFREIDPLVRQTLYSPFVFPHTWFQETRIHLPEADRWSRCLTVRREVESEARFVRQTSCPGHFAIIRLRLLQMLEDRSILFRNDLDEASDAPLTYVEAALEGVTDALGKQSGADRGVSHLRIDLLTLRHHPVDSQSRDFARTAGQAVEQCVEEAGLVEI
jgi:hypothetical protein